MDTILAILCIPILFITLSIGDGASRDVPPVHKPKTKRR